MCLAEHWDRAHRALQGQWHCACGGTLPGAVPAIPVTYWHAVTWAVLRLCLEARAVAVWCRQSRESLW